MCHYEVSLDMSSTILLVGRVIVDLLGVVFAFIGTTILLLKGCVWLYNLLINNMMGYVHLDMICRVRTVI